LKKQDQSTFKKKQPDAWGVKLRNGLFVGPNLLGQFLMELRDTGTISYNFKYPIYLLDKEVK
jgi:hypothetical protein